jgi:hypothetical protein
MAAVISMALFAVDWMFRRPAAFTRNVKTNHVSHFHQILLLKNVGAVSFKRHAQGEPVMAMSRVQPQSLGQSALQAISGVKVEKKLS